MKKLIPFLVSGVLVAGMVGCQEAPKTGSETTGTSTATPVVPAKPASDTTRIIDNSTATPTATPTTTPTTTSKSTTDLKTEISKKLKTVLPGNKLEITNKDGEIILKGTATSQKEITQAETFIKAIPGVKSVKLEAIVKTEKKP
ncbi:MULTISPECIES: BON domain-containing protein [Aphanizomenonaceae]|uniref:BON domain-containing protein n=1 Tax=Dolichospermum heterosporum TAC447 TaxID=747523 RepID=A0ABY5LMT5_9CYAN|nr:MULTISPECIES: BON domain-containing protein [Aphanizomenonaceae]MBE9257949.1 BON domain-containing protein [Dolichospermum sp. LEGE 00246]MDK2410000.1 BON domain-containing protein [Aphanizomenon sp. 202]MDK2458401.1 BON domain-containing protein [Aphanizomenon sp. PH219]UUO13267.1 BON domain-containing protein [Dolichospermum heterosporum TAC447]